MKRNKSCRRWQRVEKKSAEAESKVHRFGYLSHMNKVFYAASGYKVNFNSVFV